MSADFRQKVAEIIETAFRKTDVNPTCDNICDDCMRQCPAIAAAEILALVENKCKCAAGPWQTGKPEKDGYYLAAWKDGTLFNYDEISFMDRYGWNCSGSDPDYWAEVKSPKEAK